MKSDRYHVETTHGIYPAGTWGYRSGFFEIGKAVDNCLKDERIRDIHTNVIFYGPARVEADAEAIGNLYEELYKKSAQIDDLQDALDQLLKQKKEAANAIPTSECRPGTP